MAAHDDDDLIDAVAVEKAFRRLSPLHQELFQCIRIERRSYEEIERLTGFTKRRVMREMARTIYWLACHVDDVVVGRKANVALRFWRDFWQP